MPTNELTINLTEDQQKQIKQVTGKSITQLQVAVASTGNLATEELENVFGGKAIFDPPIDPSL